MTMMKIVSCLESEVLRQPGRKNQDPLTCNTDYQHLCRVRTVCASTIYTCGRKRQKKKEKRKKEKKRRREEEKKRRERTNKRKSKSKSKTMRKRKRKKRTRKGPNVLRFSGFRVYGLESLFAARHSWVSCSPSSAAPARQ